MLSIKVLWKRPLILVVLVVLLEITQMSYGLPREILNKQKRKEKASTVQALEKSDASNSSQTQIVISKLFEEFLGDSVDRQLVSSITNTISSICNSLISSITSIFSSLGSIGGSAGLGNIGMSSNSTGCKVVDPLLLANIPGVFLGVPIVLIGIAIVIKVVIIIAVIIGGLLGPVFEELVDEKKNKHKNQGYSQSISQYGSPAVPSSSYGSPNSRFSWMDEMNQLTQNVAQAYDKYSKLEQEGSQGQDTSYSSNSPQNQYPTYYTGNSWNDNGQSDSASATQNQPLYTQSIKKL